MKGRNAITSLGENNLQRKDIDRLHVPTDSSKRDVEYTAPEELSDQTIPRSGERPPHTLMT